MISGPDLHMNVYMRAFFFLVYFAVCHHEISDEFAFLPRASQILFARRKDATVNF